MIHQQRVSNELINTILVEDTPYQCKLCGFETNGKDLLKFHIRDWTEIHKLLKVMLSSTH